MPPAGFDPASPEREWPHTHALDRAATANSLTMSFSNKIYITAKQGASIPFVVL